ncbi:hypothetical protein diail_2092 [Diaporthe ilicicola]|nr:hypothetical protein diail_2092 [Diaporthe ilicicola]
MNATTRDAGNSTAEHQIQNPSGSTSLFRLPPELRRLVWKFLLPGRKVLKARSYRAQLGPIRRQYRRFGFDSKVSQPILSQICAESRNYVLDHGRFTFGLEGEAGLWWGFEDVLLFDEEWCSEIDNPSLRELHGLDCVKNIALDGIQAQRIHYIYKVSHYDKSGHGSHASRHDANTYGDPYVGSMFSSTYVPPGIDLYCLKVVDKSHFLVRFKALKSLMVFFEHPSRTNNQITIHLSATKTIPLFFGNNEGYDCVTFNRHINIKEADDEMKRPVTLTVNISKLKPCKLFRYFGMFKDQHVLFDF